jgi:hypothetical protein
LLIQEHPQKSELTTTQLGEVSRSGSRLDALIEKFDCARWLAIFLRNLRPNLRRTTTDALVCFAREFIEQLLRVGAVAGPTARLGHQDTMFRRFSRKRRRKGMDSVKKAAGVKAAGGGFESSVWRQGLCGLGQLPRGGDGQRQRDIYERGFERWLRGPVFN